MQVIQIKDVCKAFDQRQVLNNISLSVEEGEIFGLLGPSGAGKTTLIKMLIGLLSATSGNIAILGKELDKKIDESFPSFGMVLDNDGLYDRLNCYDNLELYARIYSISNRKKVINDLLEKVGLIHLVNGYHIEDAFPIDSEKFRLFLKEHIDLNDEHQVSAARTHLTRIRAYQTLDFLDELL